MIVRDVRGDEVVLRGGEAIGLYEGSELRRMATGASSQPATLVVARSLGLSESAAKITPGRHTGSRRRSL